MINFFSAVPYLVKEKATVEKKNVSTEVNDEDNKAADLNDQLMAESLLMSEMANNKIDAKNGEKFKLFALKKGAYLFFFKLKLI